MQINWTVIIIVGIIAIGLVIFLALRNQKDEEKFEEEQNKEGTFETEHSTDANDDIES